MSKVNNKKLEQCCSDVFIVKACVFYQIFIFHQMIALQKL